MNDQLTAGPELDARIATEVMGWRFDERWGQIVPPEQMAGPDEMWRPSEHGYELVGENAAPHVGYSVGYGDGKIFVPKYSTDIADAWRVLEHLQPPPRDEGWFTFTRSWLGLLPLAHMSTREAAFAICRAALDYVERSNA